MLNKLRNKESGFRCQTWQIRCKRNKAAAVDKAFMHSGKQLHKTPPKRSLGHREKIGDARITIRYLRVGYSTGTLRYAPRREGMGTTGTACIPSTEEPRKIKATPSRCADAPPWKVATDCLTRPASSFHSVHMLGEENGMVSRQRALNHQQ
ncbi:hypothetical protein KCP70_25520 [Salmonella enterica subsp. enterica]|nr:hypothetical protein KCP70_25520 [Salmonella enterica subsp. enterica]